MGRTLRVGTRASLLARTQTEWVCGRLRRVSAARLRLVFVRTLGDRVKSSEVFGADRTGVFTKAIERQLALKKVDLAVHSLKDLPTRVSGGSVLCAFPKREDAGDVLISKPRYSLRTLPSGSVVGTGSPRRRAQLLALRPDLRVVDLRGNLDTRVRRALQRDGLDAIIVAKAGLKRLRRYLRHARDLDPGTFLPAVGQGALAIQARSTDTEAIRVSSKLNHRQTELAVRAERAFLAALRGGCRVPVGARAVCRGGRIELTGAVFSTRSNKRLVGRCSGSADAPEAAGRKLARLLLRRGAGRLLREARHGGRS